eukprot:TRINITY_DN15397_c0_g1_i1.p1 TRINITY_DN15397_c0_g1~~TRINITY_DN15397_c0_g1_i1.p1  ORF type:complete len:649 (-),score=77.86 TRINITY_DN15397_c0_g1_i1:204-2150(-)
MAKSKKVRAVCRNFAGGTCAFGAQCRFRHAETSVPELEHVDPLLPDDVDMQDLTAQIVELVEKSKYSKLLAEIDRLRQAESTYRATIANVESSLKVSQDELKRAICKADEFELQLNAERVRNVELKETLESTKADLQGASSKADELEARLKARISTDEGLKKKLEFENVILSDRLRTHVSKINSLEKELMGATNLRCSYPNVGAQWEFNTAGNEWSSFPADRSEQLLVHHNNYAKGIGPSMVRMKCGVEEYDLHLDSLTQRNVKSGKQRSIRCTFYAPKHWTRTISLETMYDAERVESVELSGSRWSENNTIYYKCADYIINGAPVWWNRTGELMMYSSNHGNTMCVAAVGPKYTAVRDGRESVGKLKLIGSLQPRPGRWEEWDESSQEFRHAAVAVVVKQPQIPDMTVLMNIAVEVIDVGILSSLLDMVKGSVFHQCAHHGASDCTTFKEKVRLVRVLRIENWHLWQKYQRNLEHLKRDMLKYGVKTTPIDPPLSKDLVEFSLKYCQCRLDTALNESFLFHGTTYETTVKIALEGFDFRLSKPGYYGHGTYFASQACKSHQYTKSIVLHTLIVSRVAVGDIYYAEKVDKECRRPPVHNGTSRSYDSVVAKPGPMPGHHQNNQTHQEFVIFDKLQTYPELIVQYATDA